MNAGTKRRRTDLELGQEVKKRRVDLGMTQLDVLRAAEGKVSDPTLRAVENGRTNPSPLTLAALSRALGWPPNALAQIREGEDPELFNQPEAPAECTVELAVRADPLLSPPQRRYLLDAYRVAVKLSESDMEEES